MDIVLLIKSIIGLVSVLLVLVFFLVYVPKYTKKQKPTGKKSQNKTDTQLPEKIPTFVELMCVIKNKNSSTQELAKALDTIIKEYGDIPPKMGVRVHPEFYKYGEIILRICRHKQTNKDIIIKFYKELLKRNPSYAKEIDDSLTKGLNSLGQ